MKDIWSYALIIILSVVFICLLLPFTNMYYHSIYARKMKTIQKNQPITNVGESKKRKLCLIFVGGMGTTQHIAKDIYNQIVKGYCSNNEKHFDKNDVIVAWFSTSRILLDIINMKARYEMKFSNESYKDLNNLISLCMNRYERVVLLGYSYGGGVCNVVYENFKYASTDKTKLVIFTFGSVYISKFTREDIELTNYVYKGDVVIRLHKKYDKDSISDKNIIMLKNKSVFKKSWLRSVYFGTGTEWDIHRDYEVEMRKVIMSQKKVSLDRNNDVFLL